MNVLSLCSGIGGLILWRLLNELVAAVVVPRGVFRSSNQFEIVRVVVRAVMILVMNVIAIGYRAMMRLPNVTMQKGALPIGGRVVPRIPKGVFLILKYNIRQGAQALPQRKRTFSEHLIDRLSCYTECPCNLAKTVALLIEGKHSFCFGVLAGLRHA